MPMPTPRKIKKIFSEKKRIWENKFCFFFFYADANANADAFCYFFFSMPVLWPAILSFADANANAGQKFRKKI